ncbi:MAG: CvpA family protein [FCB group bacterium]|nr:CvpA family protein [FCB group bacterium]
MVLFLDGLAGFFLLGMGVIGFRRGLIEELGRLLGLIFAASVSMRYYVDLAGNIKTVLDLDPWVLLLLSNIILFSITLLIIRFLTKLTHYLLVYHSTRWMNKSMGFVFGMVKGVIIIALAIWVMELSPLDKWAEIIQRESRLARGVSKTRVSVVDFFGWSDPVKKGEKYIKSFMTDISDKKERP